MRPWATMPEAELLTAVLGRAPGAWVGFYGRYERLIGACIKKTLRRYSALYIEEDVEDLSSTVCLNLVKDDFRKLRSYDAERGYKLSSWIGLIAVNSTLDELRRREPTHASIDGSGEDAGMAIPDTRSHAGDVLERREQWTAVITAIGSLSATDREFIDLYYNQEAEPEAIAKHMGISVNTVYSRKNKLRDKLRKLIDDAETGKIAAPPA